MEIVLGVVLGLLAIWALLLVLLYLLRPRDVGLGAVVSVVPDVLRLGRGLVVDPTVPVRVRLALVLLVVWLVNPIDLVPEFVPVLGPLDDVIVTVLVLRYVRAQLGTEELRRRWPGSADGYDVLARLIGR